VRLNAIVDIVKGELQNSSFVASFENIRLDCTKVRREDLFIAKDNNDIKQALENGAYIIIYCGIINDITEETAFIKVDNIYKAMELILRYFIASKNIINYKIEKNTFLVGREILRDDNALFVENLDLETLISTNNIFDEIKYIFFFEDKLKKSIFPKVTQLRVKKLDIQILKSSLFFTDIMFRDEIFKIEILKYYVEYLIKIIEIFKSKNINFKIKDKIRTDIINHINNKIVISLEDIELYKYLKNNMPWATVLNSFNLEKEDCLKIIENGKFDILLTDLKFNEINIKTKKQGLLF
jgi:ferrochelatase